MQEGYSFEHLLVERSEGVARVTLNRPEVRNAFNPELIAELTRCFDALGADPAVRVVVLTGAGSAFSAGADLNWMERAAGFSAEENLRDALALTDMLQAIDGCVKPVIGRVNGHAFAGGVGLVACCDVVIADEMARFALTEVRLGLTPATVSPYVVRKIGASAARALFVTADRFDSFRAREIGLVHEVVPKADLDAAVARCAGSILRGGPIALAAAKRLIADIQSQSYDEQRTYTAAMIAALRQSAEGREGVKAFLQKRNAAWVPEAASG
jgi:methylglutaconyl-CoA hydratase